MPARGAMGVQLGAKSGAQMVPIVEIVDSQKTTFYLMFFNKNELLGGEHGAIVGPCDGNCMT